MPSETRERILESSGELFRRQGYMGTGVKQIVAEAGAPFGSLYHFFPGGKEELGAETIRRSGRLYGLLLGEYAGPEVELVAGIRAFFDGAAETLRETDYADACPIATVALEVSSTNEALRRACADVFEGWIAGGTERFVAEGIPRERAARAGDPDDRRARGRLRPQPRPAQHRAGRAGRRDGRQSDRGRATSVKLGEVEIGRLGFGAMRITGKGVWGAPADRELARAVLRRAPELGIDLIDTADSYGPHVSEELIAEVAPSLRGPDDRDQGRPRAHRPRKVVAQRPTGPSQAGLRGLAAAAEGRAHRPLPAPCP